MINGLIYAALPSIFVDLYQESLNDGRVHAHAIEASKPLVIDIKSNAATFPKPKGAFEVAYFIENPRYEAHNIKRTEDASPTVSKQKKTREKKTKPYW